jgi:cellulose synthase/poly-beta-1,6-N-acetylglucosamine synthase-like glycosyltransferase
MVRLVGLIAQATLIVLALYNGITALWGWPDRRPAHAGQRQRKLRVVVPAHNEQTVIENLLRDISDNRYPAELSQVWVLADRCDDDTAKLSRNLGALVAERKDGLPGKGPTIAWHLESLPLTTDEALVVFDADNRVPQDALERIVDELDSGHHAVQCYLDVTDINGSLLAEASALSYWAGNRMVQLARANLGWSADLGGTGMALTSEALEAAGGFSASLTEDQDLGIRLLLAGHRVEWLHDVRIQDEKPRNISVMVRQRARWMAGKRSARRQHLAALLKNPTPARVDMAVRLIQPGRSFVALTSGVFAVASVVTRSEWLLPWEAWVAITAIQVLEPIPFLAREGVGPRQLLRYPLLTVIAAMWLPVRVVSSLVRGWYHTPHVGPTSDNERGTVP